MVAAAAPCIGTASTSNQITNILINKPIPELYSRPCSGAWRPLRWKVGSRESARYTGIDPSVPPRNMTGLSCSRQTSVDGGFVDCGWLPNPTRDRHAFVSTAPSCRIPLHETFRLHSDSGLNARPRRPRGIQVGGLAARWRLDEHCQTAQYACAFPGLVATSGAVGSADGRGRTSGRCDEIRTGFAARSSVVRHPDGACQATLKPGCADACPPQADPRVGTGIADAQDSTPELPVN